VLDDLGRLGRVWRSADVEATGFETVVTDLLEGQYKSPIGIFCFNPAEGWSRDVSEDVAGSCAGAAICSCARCPPVSGNSSKAMRDAIGSCRCRCAWCDR
jgi:hypothetical protein